MCATLNHQDCAQQFVKTKDEDATQMATGLQDSPNSLIAQLCRSLVDPSGTPISEIQHVRRMLMRFLARDELEKLH